MYIRTFRLRKKHITLAAALAAALATCLIWAAVGHGGRAEAAAAPQAAVRLPVLMYHHILKDTAKSGTYVITPDLLEGDLKYLRDNGYTAVTPGELIAFEQGGELPEKPVMLTFDDGYLSFEVYAMPLIEKYDFKAVVSTVSAYTDRYSEAEDEHVAYAHLSWEDLSDLLESGRVELANHSYDMHSIEGRRGTTKRSDESAAAYKKALYEDVLKAQRLFSQHLGTEPVTFTYPFGAFCEEELPMIEDMGFLCTLSCTEGINELTRAPGELFLLKRANRSPEFDLAAFLGG